MQDPDADRFLEWFVSNGGWIDSGCKLERVPGMGRGLVAKRAFNENERVFSIPRKILMNLGTSSLESACLAVEAKNPDLARTSWSDLVNRGWCPLILMMMYENWRAAQATQDSWGAYFGMSRI